MRGEVRPRRELDMCEVFQLLLEALLKWDVCSFPGASYTEDLGLASRELSNVGCRLKYVERSEAYEGLNVFLDDGTSYLVRIERRR